jgi:hypothetical protein
MSEKKCYLSWTLDEIESQNKYSSWTNNTSNVLHMHSTHKCRRGRDRMVVGFTTDYAIRDYRDRVRMDVFPERKHFKKSHMVHIVFFSNYNLLSWGAVEVMIVW